MKIESLGQVAKGFSVSNDSNKDYCSSTLLVIDNFKNEDGTTSKSGQAVIDLKYLNLKPNTKIKVTIEVVK